MNSIFNSFIQKSEKGLSYALQENITEKSFIIDCSKLEDYLTSDIRNLGSNYCELFKELQKIDGPAIYWYEITSNTDNSKIIETFKRYKDSNNVRPTPAFNHYDHIASHTLYVGKVQGCLWGRVIQHLGYHKDATDHGLQLYHWAKPLSLMLELHVIPINTEIEHLLPSLEIYFAKELKPLLGRH